MCKPSSSRYSLLKRAERGGYPAMDFEMWYQQGLQCYHAALPKPLRKQALRAVAKRWVEAYGDIAAWQLRAFAYGARGLGSCGPSRVPPDFEWPSPPDASWSMVVCCYPDGGIELDFVHPVSRRFWSEDNGFLDELPGLNKSWFAEMGFDLMVMMPVAALGPRQNPKSHLSVV
jgi:hypothetical protein